MAVKHKYNGVLPGAPRVSFTTLNNYPPSATQPSARCLTPWLRWSGPVKNRNLTSLQDQECMFRGRGLSQMVIGSAALPDHVVTARESRANKSPLAVISSHPSFPPLHMGWLNCFRVLSPKACGTLSILYGDNSSGRSYLYMSALSYSSRTNCSNT
jgi:hypothetical protein